MKNRLFFKILALTLVCALCLSAVPVLAFAVTQDEVNAMRAERDAIAAKRQEKQAVVDQLEAEQAGVMERKRAMDERNAYTLQQIQLNNEEIAIYDEMISAKAREVDAARTLEAEQLERYRVRIRAMEENGGYGILAMVLRTSSLSEFLTVMDDVGEIMQSSRRSFRPRSTRPRISSSLCRRISTATRKRSMRSARKRKRPTDSSPNWLRNWSASVRKRSADAGKRKLPLRQLLPRLPLSPPPARAAPAA